MSSEVSASLITFLTFNVLFFTVTMANCPEDTSKLFGCVDVFKNGIDFKILGPTCCSLYQSCLCNQTVINNLMEKVGSLSTFEAVCLKHISFTRKCD
ncbi:unnamed protein product [Eruca vesicaria subsp. sativa]|uniref:Uncharacterized protein n=1 Tax=Eruca vesicaria subsp. sativa TaxID=29727 RepID=A0ABC8KDS9_ERUVS|nr:unnamed protein product [Eruca vesicaria subsp. sativa]